jgi:hypothetical protein
MKVYGSPGASAPISGRSASRASGQGFAPQEASEAEAPASAARAAMSAGVGSLEALLALQETLSPLERRRRAVKRASRILDALDDLRLAALGADTLDGPALQRLAGAVQDARSETDDPKLEGVLEEIEIRAAVEMAKREVRAAA